MDKKRFNWLNIQKVPDDSGGLYFIWSRNVCVYVGKAERQSLRSRLTQHYSDSHNAKLKNWISSSHPLWFSFEIVKNMEAINAKERNRIKTCAPIANKLLRKTEAQYGDTSSSI